MKYDVDADHGKFKIQASYNGESGTSYLVLNYITKNLTVDGYYLSEADGVWSKSKLQNENVRSVIGGFGFLEFDYKDFTYDDFSKNYKANSFEYYFESNETLLISDCVISIADGFPKTVDFDYSTDKTSNVKIHYSLVFSDYGKVTVTLPDISQGNTNATLPEPDADKITFTEFERAYAKRNQADYNHVDVNVEVKSTEVNQNMFMSADLVYGMWQSEKNDINNDTVNGFILSDEQIAMFAENYYKYYYDSIDQYYYIYADSNTAGLDLNIAVCVAYNKDFYAVKEEVMMDSMYEAIEIKWSKVNRTEPLMMNVSGRSFVGVDIQEKNYAYYDATVATTKGATIDFDKNGLCQMILTKNNSGNEIVDTYIVMYGKYVQNGNVIEVRFEYVSDGETRQEIPEESIEPSTFVINDDKIVLATSSLDENNQPFQINMIFAFDAPFTGNIDYPEKIVDTSHLEGSYYFVTFDYELKDGGTEEEAINAIVAISSDETTRNYFVNTAIAIMEEGTSLAFIEEKGSYSGQYSIVGNQILASLDTYYDHETQKTSHVAPQDFVCTINGDGSLSICVSTAEHYNIYAVYQK